mmetsp:Transcript_2077/g.4681  ORF Transcript_2077/g.4681 Transcript_2077/m.4681 type:complete len:423 (+) Transcript_2077:98-1366(+)
MCGRVACTLAPAQLRRIARAQRTRNLGNYRPKYNMAPTNTAPVIYEKKNKDNGGGRERVVHAMRWGLIPSYAKKETAFTGEFNTINARSENVANSPVYRRLVNSKRCVVVADGFYEWKANPRGGKKLPHFIRLKKSVKESVIEYHDKATAATAASEAAEPPAKKIKTDTQSTADGAMVEYDGESLQWPPEGTDARQAVLNENEAPLLMAGLYDAWKDPDSGEWLYSYTVLTMDSSHTPVEGVHDRMPVFLTPETASLWLDCEGVPLQQCLDTVKRQAAKLCQESFELYEVPPLVSNMRNNSIECVMPKDQYDKAQFNKGIGRFFSPTSQTKKDPGSAAASAALPAPAIKKQEMPSAAAAAAIKREEASSPAAAGDGGGGGGVKKEEVKPKAKQGSGRGSKGTPPPVEGKGSIKAFFKPASGK